MKIEYILKRTATTIQRQFRFESKPNDKNTIGNILLKAGAAALLPIVLKLIVLAGQQLLATLPQ